MFSEFLDNQFLSIIQSLEGFSQKQDPEFIHQIRVDIKKIRAVYAFIKKTTGEESIPKKILPDLFDDAGTLRELQLNITLLEGFDIPEGLVEPLKTKEKFLSEAFVLKIPRYVNEVKRVETEIPFPAIEGKIVKNYFEHMVDKSQLLLTGTAGAAGAEDLHRFRRQIKNMAYVYSALPEKLQNQANLNEEYLSDLQKKAGDWHDAYVSSRFFETFTSFPEDTLDKIKHEEKRKLRSLLRHSHSFDDKVYNRKH